MIIRATHFGRPSDFSERAENEQRCYDLLDSLGVEYFAVDHERTDTIEACREIEKLLGAGICKNLFLSNRQQTEFYLLIMPGDKPFKTKLLSKQIGSSRLSFASAEHMLELLAVTPGSVSILGLMHDKENAVRLLIDSDALKPEYFGCHPCMNSTSLRIKTADILNIVLPAVRHEYTAVELPWDPE